MQQASEHRAGERTDVYWLNSSSVRPQTGFCQDSITLNPPSASKSQIPIFPPVRTLYKYYIVVFFLFFFCPRRIRTWLPGGRSINTAWQATWLLGACVNSLGLLRVKASVFLQFWGMIRGHQPSPRFDLSQTMALPPPLLFLLKVLICPTSVSRWRGRRSRFARKQTKRWRELEHLRFFSPFF